MPSEIVFKFAAAALVLVSVIFSRNYFTNSPPNITENLTEIAHVEINEQKIPAEQKQLEQVEQLERLEQVDQSLNPKPSTLYPKPSTLQAKPDPALPENPKPSSTPNPQFETLTEKEVFELQHPRSYLNYLGKLQDLMIKEGILGIQEKEIFDSEDKVLDFWRDPGFKYMTSLNLATDEHREQFLKGLHEVRVIHNEEARQLRASLGKIEVEIPRNFTHMVQALKGIMLQEAQAQTCFVPGPPTQTPGINLIAPCCNCFAGPFPIGCLNAVCVGRPALYDQTTFICGCSL